MIASLSNPGGGGPPETTHAVSPGIMCGLANSEPFASGSAFGNLHLTAKEPEWSLIGRKDGKPVVIQGKAAAFPAHNPPLVYLSSWKNLK